MQAGRIGSVIALGLLILAGRASAGEKSHAKATAQLVSRSDARAKKTVKSPKAQKRVKSVPAPSYRDTSFDQQLG